MMSAHTIKTEVPDIPQSSALNDTSMPSASTAPQFNTSFGINSVSNIISQMPKHPVQNIQCQSREEIKTAITLLFHWTIAQRTKNSSFTRQYLGSLIVAGLSGLASDWWHFLPAEARNEMLLANDVDQQILKALGKQFHGDDQIDDTEHLSSLFMSARLCNLSQAEA